MGNSKLANGCQAASGTDATAAAPSLNGILAQVPGHYVAAASLTLAPPSAAGPLHEEVEVDAGHVGRVRLFFEQKTARAAGIPTGSGRRIAQSQSMAPGIPIPVRRDPIPFRLQAG